MDKVQKALWKIAEASPGNVTAEDLMEKLREKSSNTSITRENNEYTPLTPEKQNPSEGNQFMRPIKNYFRGFWRRLTTYGGLPESAVIIGSTIPAGMFAAHGARKSWENTAPIDQGRAAYHVQRYLDGKSPLAIVTSKNGRARWEISDPNIKENKSGGRQSKNSQKQSANQQILRDVRRTFPAQDVYDAQNFWLANNKQGNVGKEFGNIEIVYDNSPNSSQRRPNQPQKSVTPTRLKANVPPTAWGLPGLRGELSHAWRTGSRVARATGRGLVEGGATLAGAWAVNRLLRAALPWYGDLMHEERAKVNNAARTGKFLVGGKTDADVKKFGETGVKAQ